MPTLSPLPSMLSRWAPRILLGILLLCLGSLGRAETVVESSVESRFQLDLHVPDAALLQFLPAGWTLNIAAQGAAKDANLRAVFIDRIAVHGPDGKPVGKTGSSRLVWLVAPVKDSAGAAAQLVIGGLTEDPADAPGLFGVYLPASTHRVQFSVSSMGGVVTESQDWAFAAATGERLEMHIKYERGVGKQKQPKRREILFRQESCFLPNLTTAAGAGHSSKRDDGSSGSRERVFLPSFRRQLLQAV